MRNTGPAVSPVVAATIISLMAGGATGYYVRYFQATDGAPRIGASMSGMGGGRRPGGASQGGPAAGGGGFGGGQPTSATALSRLVRDLNTIEQVQNAGLSSEQKQTLLPVLTRLKAADKLSDKECQDAAAAINSVLSAPQKQALENLQPQRGVGGGATGSRGGMGAQPDPERPFASEREKAALDGLMKNLQSAAAR